MGREILDFVFKFGGKVVLEPNHSSAHPSQRKVDLKISPRAQSQTLAGTPAMQGAGEHRAGEQRLVGRACAKPEPLGASSSNLCLQLQREPVVLLEG